MGECHTIGRAEDNFGQFLLIEVNTVRLEQTNPFAHMEAIAIHQHTIHIKDNRGGQRRVQGHSLILHYTRRRWRIEREGEL